MTEFSADLSEYVRSVQEKTLKYVRDLIAENANLCALIQTLDRELDRERKSRLQMEDRIASIDAERRAYLERYLEVEEQNANVSNLYVATLRLHGSIGRGDVLSAIHEIVINLVGCEELAVFEMMADGSALRLSSSFGIDPARFDVVPLGVGAIGACAQLGRLYVASTSMEDVRTEEETDLTACIPLIVEGVVTGAVAVFRLLKHKQKLEAIDPELFGLIGSHGAMALYCTSLVENTGGRRSLHARAASEIPQK